MDACTAGRYRQGRLLGRGGMATVFLGFDVRLGRTVAIKRLSTRYADDASARALFFAEARYLARLNHPGVTRIYDSGEAVVSSPGTGLPFLVIELVDGDTLQAWMRRHADVRPDLALRLASAVAGALEHCHQAGVVHADVKPANVMLTRSGQLKLIDFGLARESGAGGSRDRRETCRFATAEYMSPEQVRGAAVDVASDVYSTGCLLYHLLVGRPPFVGETFSDVASHHLLSPAPRASSIRPGLGAEIDEVLSRCLAKNPDDRYPSVRELGVELDRLLARPAPPVIRRTVITTPQRSFATALPRTEGTVGHRRLALAGAVLAALLLPVAASSLERNAPAITASPHPAPGLAGELTATLPMRLTSSAEGAAAAPDESSTSPVLISDRARRDPKPALHRPARAGSPAGAVSARVAAVVVRQDATEPDREAEVSRSNAPRSSEQHGSTDRRSGAADDPPGNKASRASKSSQASESSQASKASQASESSQASEAPRRASNAVKRSGRGSSAANESASARSHSSSQAARSKAERPRERAERTRPQRSAEVKNQPKAKKPDRRSDPQKPAASKREAPADQDRSRG